MFYTGIITSFLPYILIIGVFGTLLWNNTFHPSDKTQQTSYTESCFEHHPARQHIAKAYLYKNFKIQARFDTPDPHTPHTIVQQSDSTCSHTPGLYHHQEPPGKKQAGLNHTFSFRGPPSVV